MTTYYILTRCEVHSDHFFIRASEPGEIDMSTPIRGPTVQIFSAEVRTRLADLEAMRRWEDNDRTP